MEPESSSVLWIVIVGFIIAFVLAFGIGANDVANSFGTSVGAKVLTLKQACIVAGIFEMAGAILLGTKVSDTVRKGIIDISIFNNMEKHAMVGAFSALLGTSIWLIVATFFKLPVSGTHSVVGATIGYALVATGAKGVNWSKFGMIAASWVISPLLSGIISSVIFILIRRFILKKSNPFKHGLRSIPLFYGVTFAINLFSVFYDSSEIIGTGHLPAYIVLGMSLGAGVVIFLLVHFIVAPWLKKRILASEQTAIQSSVHNSMAANDDDENDFDVPDLMVTEETAEQNGDICMGDVGQNDISDLRVPKMSYLLRKVLDPDEITVTSSLPSEDNEDTVTSKTGAQLAASLHVPNRSQEEVNVPEEVKICAADDHTVIDITSNVSTEISTDISTICGDEPASPGVESQQGRFHVTIDTDHISIDNELSHHSAVPTTPALGRRTDELNLIDGPRRTSECEQSDTRSRPLTEKEQARALARSLVADDPKTAKLFKFLQVMTASFGAFAHGGNDVSNAIGPVISIWIIYNTGELHSKASTPIWILLYGGLGIVIGLCVWGRRVIETIGENLTPVTPTSGFSIEIGAAFTVLLASNLGIPVSTTHCKVGSVVLTGRVRSRDVVDWSLFVNIVVSWVVTMPVTGLISAGVYAAIVAIM